MLSEGATSFWEQYLPGETGSEHLAMYGRPFGRSLCHSWGASPVYLLGKYYLGVKPTSYGYSNFDVQPSLGGLEWMRGRVPVNGGTVDLYMDSGMIKITASKPGGVLRVRSSKLPRTNKGRLIEAGKDLYELELEESGVEYLVKYNP